MKKIIITLLAILIFSSPAFSEIQEKTAKKKSADLTRDFIVFFNNGEYDKALDICNKGIKLDKNNYIHYSNKCQIFIHKKMFNEAVTQCDNILELEPEFAVICLLKGALLYRLGLLERSQETFGKAIEILDKKIDKTKEKNKRLFHEESKALALILFGKEKEGLQLHTRVMKESPSIAFGNSKTISKEELIDFLLINEK